jgi:hypothetical protein
MLAYTIGVAKGAGVGRHYEMGAKRLERIDGG